MDETLTGTRCLDCGQGLAFSEWSAGASQCTACRARPGHREVRPAPVAPSRPGTVEYDSYMRMLDEVPDELVDELVAALEAEAARALTPSSSAPASPAVAAVREVLREIAGLQSGKDVQWAAWGFAGGFALNVLVAKYAQMTSGGSFAAFVAPMLVGGLVAGAACGGIAWGVSRLREQ